MTVDRRAVFPALIVAYLLALGAVIDYGGPLAGWAVGTAGAIGLAVWAGRQ